MDRNRHYASARWQTVDGRLFLSEQESNEPAFILGRKASPGWIGKSVEFQQRRGTCRDRCPKSPNGLVQESLCPTGGQRRNLTELVAGLAWQAAFQLWFGVKQAPVITQDYWQAEPTTNACAFSVKIYRGINLVGIALPGEQYPDHLSGNDADDQAKQILENGVPNHSEDCAHSRHPRDNRSGNTRGADLQAPAHCAGRRFAFFPAFAVVVT